MRTGYYELISVFFFDFWDLFDFERVGIDGYFDRSDKEVSFMFIFGV